MLSFSHFSPFLVTVVSIRKATCSAIIMRIAQTIHCFSFIFGMQTSTYQTRSIVLKKDCVRLTISLNARQISRFESYIFNRWASLLPSAEPDLDAVKSRQRLLGRHLEPMHRITYPMIPTSFGTRAGI